MAQPNAANHDGGQNAKGVRRQRVAANPKPTQQRLKSRLILRRDSVCGPLPRLEAGAVFADIVRTQKEVTSLGLHLMSQFIDMIALSGEPRWDRTNDHLIKR